ncbi:hypothetical protein SPURM210S_02994 [Streptomyces purpurascens]
MGDVRTRTRRRRALPWVVVGLWLAALVLLGPLAGKFAGVQQNRAVDYLPDSADSTQVARVQDRLPGGESTDLVLVYHRDGGLTDADRRTAADQVAEVSGAYDLTGGEARGVPSKDGSTLMYPVSSTQPGQDEEARDAFVDGVRDIAEGGGGLSVEVGGPGALNTDMNKVFGTLDATLLLATLGVVTVLLVLIYRSPFLWLVPLAVAGVAAATAMAAGYGLHELFDVTVTGQSGGVMTVLVLGAGTDYALLIVSRYREELRRHERPYDAMRTALRGCGPAVLASSGTVAAGLLCLLAADLNSSSGMGPVGMVGVLAALVAMTTLLPAVLVLLGRRVFWPLIPAFGSEPKARRSLFAAMGTSATRRPALVLVGGGVLLGALALGTLNLSGSIKQEDSFTERPESITAMRTLAQEYPERSSRPVTAWRPRGGPGRWRSGPVRPTVSPRWFPGGVVPGGRRSPSSRPPRPRRRRRPAPSRRCGPGWILRARMSAGPAPSRSTWPTASPGTARWSCRWCSSRCSSSWSACCAASSRRCCCWRRWSRCGVRRWASAGWCSSRCSGSAVRMRGSGCCPSCSWSRSVWTTASS